MYRCECCGFCSDKVDDFEEDMREGSDGMWCPDCDAYVFKDPEKATKGKYNVLLEYQANTHEKCKKKKMGHIKLPKRVSPLRYPGGKSQIVDLLYAYIGKGKKVFVDAFCGGGSVGLAMLMGGVVEKLVMNDKDMGVYCFFDMVLNRPERLIEMIHSQEPTRDMFFRYREMIKNNYKGYDKDDIAFGFLVVNRCGFSGIWNSYPTSHLLQRWNPQTLEKRIKRIHEYKDKIILTCQDACEVIEEYYWDDDCTIFIDPPYVLAEKVKLYHCYYIKEDHIKLAQLLNTLKWGYPGCADMLVTYDYNEMIQELYDGIAKVQGFPRQYSLS